MLLFRFVLQNNWQNKADQQIQLKSTARNVPVTKSPIYMNLLHRMLQDHSRPVSPVVHTFQVFSMREERGTTTNFTGNMSYFSLFCTVPSYFGYRYLLTFLGTIRYRRYCQCESAFFFSYQMFFANGAEVLCFNKMTL